MGGLAMALTPVLSWGSTSTGANKGGRASRLVSLNSGWLFRENPGGATIDRTNDAAFQQVTLPHCVTRLSWQNWDPVAWQDVWLYRRHFTLPQEFEHLRVFLHFDGVMVAATPTLNGHELPKHLGGYLPFEYEITNWLNKAGNTLDVAVDSRWSNVPPEGSPIGAKQVDYLEAGGIYRSACLKAVPQIFISDVFAKPVQAIESTRKVEVSCALNAAMTTAKPVQLQVELRDGICVVARTEESVRIEKAGETQLNLTLSNLGNVALWDVDAPYLYDVAVTLLIDGEPVHDHRVRIGFREARFELDGFFLNGRRLQLFGLNRHEIYPYVGGAMPARVMRRDAEILRRDFNCNIVRCSHYPQSEAFLNACDELGLMVWEEVPGWQYLGDDQWKELLARDVKDMIIRDRNHASIVIWGVRVNESANDVPLYQRTSALARSLDDSRPASGSMTTQGSMETWHEDVFAFDDYHASPDHSVGILDPVPGYPYMLAEAVGQFNYERGKGFDSFYRRTGDANLQQLQAVFHAQAHSKAAGNPRNCGVIAWCAFDYASLVNAYKSVKTPGVADVFRIPKLGASFYLAQVDPRVRLVIEPSFYWDFGPQTPNGPGKNAAIFSNCERLELFVNGQRHSTLRPDSANYPNLKYPPFFADLDVDGSHHPELRIDGYIGKNLALSRSFSSDAGYDRLALAADDRELIGDGSDATRLVFRVADKFGANRAFASGSVALEVAGPGVIAGDNPFSLAESGGVGAVWIKSVPDSVGEIRVAAKHPALGVETAVIKVLPRINT